MKRLYTILFFLLLAHTGLKAQLIINEVLYDPSNTSLDGDANGDGVYDQEGDAFIEFVNTGYSNFDMSGYQIWDDTTTGSLEYTVPNNTIIPPQGALVIFGGGTPTGSFGGAIVLVDTGSAGLSLGNTGEIIIVKDAAGKPVLSFDSDALSNNPNESYTRNPDMTGSFEQHATNTALLFSPGTKIDGSSFNTNYAKNITFKVDMNEYTKSFTGAFVNGDYNGWCGSCNAMTDDNSDGIWEVTLPISQDSIEYKFTVDGWTDQENFAGGESCTKTTGSNVNRFLMLTGDIDLPTVCFASCGVCTPHLSLKGVIDFTVPIGGSSGKAIHVVADADISDLSKYGIGIANNGGGTDGEEYSFPAISVMSGQNILVVRDSGALAEYFDNCWSSFDLVITGSDAISQNGDDAIELFFTGSVIETFGDINVDGSGEAWEYTDSWAYKTNDNTWTYGTVDCTDDTKTIYEASCKYPICPAILVEMITVSGEAGATTISTLGGKLQMSAMVTPSNAEDTTFMWSVSDMTIATIDTNGLLQAVNNGTVTVTATANDASGIKGSVDIVITNQEMGVYDLNANLIQIFPNPATDQLNIISTIPFSEFNIYTTAGKRITSASLQNSMINITDLEPGMYFIEFTIDQLTVTKHFVKH